MLHRTYMYHRPPGAHSAQLRYIGLARRRLGRGGRVVIDRLPPTEASTDLNSTTDDYYRPRDRLDLPKPMIDPLLAQAQADKDRQDDMDLLATVYAALPAAKSCAIPVVDSGYNSPASIRSRSLQRNGQKAPDSILTAPYATVRGPRGDLCHIPITVGVSPLLYDRHAAMVRRIWASPTHSPHYVPPDAPPPSGDELPAKINRFTAHQACAAVQSLSYAEGFMTLCSGSSAQKLPVSNRLAALVTTTNGGEQAANTPPTLTNGVQSTDTTHPLPTPSPSPNDDHNNGHHLNLNRMIVDELDTITALKGAAKKAAADTTTDAQPEQQLIIERYRCDLVGFLGHSVCRANGQQNGDLVVKVAAHTATNNAAVR